LKYRFPYLCRATFAHRDRVEAELTEGIWFGRVGFEGDKGMGGVEEV
jgi:hypothetical protein